MVLLMAHMPKCGGSSFRRSLAASYGKAFQPYFKQHPLAVYQDKILYPALHPKRFERAVKHHLRRAGFKRPVIKGEVVYGHYSFGLFRPLLAKPSIKTGIFFREPVDWAGSYLQYVRRKKPYLLSGDDVEDIKRLGLEYAFEIYLGPVKVEALDYIGLMERYEESLTLYEMIFGKKLAEYTKNTNPKKLDYRQYFQQKNILPQVEALMEGNKVFYERALARYERLCKQYFD